MAKRLTDAQVRNQRSQSLRAVRRLERQVDTQIEKLERKLDRGIENKERITMRLALSIGDDYRELHQLMNRLATGLTDMMLIFQGSE